jgi:hypothetical protein
MKKIFLVIFLLFVLPNLSLADDWEPILKIHPIIEKDLNLLNKRMDINLAKSLEISNLLSHSEWAKLSYEYTVLSGLQLTLMIANEDLFVIETLLFYNKNLKGSKIFKDRLNFIINKTLNIIEKRKN